jgi:adenylate kinase
VYNVHANPPRQSGLCDACGGDLVQRDDDREETVRRRLQVYRAQTAPVVAWYASHGVAVHRVDGDRPVDAVRLDLDALVSA